LVIPDQFPDELLIHREPHSHIGHVRLLLLYHNTFCRWNYLPFQVPTDVPWRDIIV